MNWKVSDQDANFTLIFEGNIRKFEKNPLRTETPFGVPFAAGVGDAFAKIDALNDQMERAIVQIETGDYIGAIATLMEQS